jgi:ADP-ribose pyrophosphatase YjhB (NUDIX family)
MILAHPLVRRIAQVVWILQRGTTLGVRGIVIDDQRRVLLVRHGYAPGWHFPGGGVDKGETVRDAVIRELLEETAVTIVGEPVLLGVYTNFKLLPRDHVIAFVIPHYTRGPPPPPSFEIREQGFFPIDALPEGTTSGTRGRLDELLGGVAKRAAW